MIDIQIDISTGRPTVLTDEGSLIDVKNFIADIWAKDPALVTQSIYQCYGDAPKQGQSLQ